MKQSDGQVMSDERFLGFKWPPKMPSYRFKRRKSYVHEVEVISAKDPTLALLLIFSSEPKAKHAMKSMQQAKNNVSIRYNQREVPVTVEEGFIA